MSKEKKHTVDLEYFKNYVETYSYTQFQYNETFIKDMIYGIGLAIDGENFKMADGYKRFEEILLELLKEKEDDNN